METSKLKVRVNLNTREFEVEGDNDVILKNFGEVLKEYLDEIQKTPKSNTANTGNSSTKVVKETNNSEEKTESSISTVPDNFGEFYHRFPKNLSNVDKLLVACYFIQESSEGKVFTLKEANEILIQQGVKLSNTNAFNTANISTKRVFKIGAGKNYRVSDSGVEAIKSFMQQNS